ncbi:DUF2513 domain-containing protein [Ideonella sp. A 288]|uniref:DUF2513 domain-containing protein n=1 Tax=Ideonella sp. A 288 TaxID=1962181 RepID=UPI001186A705|nr:DUF2513 domain-containing protein [Ideonella sp. A 288]
MKRNLDLIRDICLALESKSDQDIAESLRDKDYTDEEIGFHSYLLGDAGFAQVADTTTISDLLPQAIPLHLTWKGYEFLESAREDKRWAKAKGAIRKIGGTSIEVAFDLLKEYAKQELGL